VAQNRRLQMMRKAGLMIAFCCILFWGAWYSGISRISPNPPAPNFAVEIGLVAPPPSSSFREVFPEGWFLREVQGWPGATFHRIDADNEVCAAHALQRPAILYKATLKARITAFRMSRFIEPSVFQPGLPQPPVTESLTPEMEKDCGNAYDLIVLPFSILERARFN